MIIRLSKKRLQEYQSTNIQERVQKDPEVGFSFIIQLTGANGSQQFDKLTKTKTVESILTIMDAGGINDYVSHLITHLDGFDGYVFSYFTLFM
jgi:DNA polymerase phi